MKTELILSPLITQLIEDFATFPGVGPKSAQRMLFHLLKEKNRVRARTLGKHLIESTHHIQNCQSCQIYTETKRCKICDDPKRNKQLLCIVESPADVLALEQSGSYRGEYFVLMGALSPLDGIGPEELKIDCLLQRLKTHPFEEIILATNATVEGEATADYIASLAALLKIKITRIAYGVPVGSELEYINPHTLARALKHRAPMYSV